MNNKPEIFQNKITTSKNRKKKMLIHIHFKIKYIIHSQFYS